MSRLSPILLPCLLFTLLLTACGVPDAPAISEGSPAPASLSPSSTAEVMTTPVITTPIGAESTPTIDTTPSPSAASPLPAESADPSPPAAPESTPTVDITPSPSAETSPLPADPADPSAPASAESTAAATITPQLINLRIDRIASANFSMQSTIALTTTREGILPLSWSPDGTRLLFERLSNLWLYNVTTNEQQFLLDNVRIATWSPDGQRIAYVPGWNRALGMEDRRVLVLDLATRRSVEIGDTQTRGPIISRLVWTPERGILLATPHEILAYPDTTVAAPPVTVFTIPPTLQVPDYTPIALAPDGRHALIESGATRQRMISFVVDGTLVKTIAIDDPTSPLWSPDGQRVVVEYAGEFLSIYSGEGELLAASTYETLKLRPLSWSPDGVYLVYSTNGGGTGPFQAYLVKPDGSGSIELAPPFPSSYGISAALWSPNNQYIAYTIDDYTAVGVEPVRATTYLMIATLANQ